MTDAEIPDWMTDGPTAEQARAALATPVPDKSTGRGWWHLPMAAEMWAADARDIDDADGW